MAWIRRLVQTLGRWKWKCVAFCEMTTHVHALLAVDDLSLPLGMKHLNLEYSRDFNARHGRSGQLLRRRYGSRPVELGTDLLETFVYVVLNPVAAGMSPRAEDWRWSSYATAIGLSRDFPFVDASRVLDAAGSSVAAVRDLVDAERAWRMARTAPSGV